MTEITKYKMRIAKLGKQRPDLIGNKWNLGRKHTLAMREKMRNLMKGNKLRVGKTTSEKQKAIVRARRGEKNNFWKGGITPLNKKIRNSIDFSLWRTAVFSRDSFTCQYCNIVGGKLNAHHIKHFSKFPELRFAIDNGITLCVNCHRNIHKNTITRT